MDQLVNDWSCHTLKHLLLLSRLVEHLSEPLRGRHEEGEKGVRKMKEEEEVTFCQLEW